MDETIITYYYYSIVFNHTWPHRITFMLLMVSELSRKYDQLSRLFVRFQLNYL